MFKEDIDVAKAIQQEIGQVIDQWVNELIKEKIVTPQMNPSYQRNLWDRLKGTLSNLWHGRYNQNNPNYWKNRFGDDLGTQESYNPRVFTLMEYKELKTIVEETENLILENLSPDLEKLRIVKIIKTSAEELKQKLYKIFVSNCSNPQDQEGASQSDKEPNEKVGDDSGDVPNAVNMDRSPADAARVVAQDNPGEPDETGSPDEVPPSKTSDDIRLKEKDYITYLPKSKENKGKSVAELIHSHQIVDAILHPDFESSGFSYTDSLIREKIISRLEDLVHDAKLKNLRKSRLDLIEKALEKFKDIVSKENA